MRKQKIKINSNTKKRKIQFFRVFIKVNEFDHKREVYAGDTTYSYVKKVADNYEHQQTSVIIIKGRQPEQVVYKYTYGNTKF